MKKPYVVLLFAAVILNVFVAWGCILWSPYTTHTKPSDELSDDGYPGKIVGPCGQPGWWFSASGFGVAEAVLSGARGSEGRFVYWRGSHTPAYFRGGWPLHSMQSTVTFKDYRARWELPIQEILKRGLQTSWFPEWLHPQPGRRLPLVPFWPGCLLNSALYFVTLTGLWLLWVRFVKPTTVVAGARCCRAMNRFVSILTLIFALLALSGCGHPRRSYPATDAFWKGEGRLPVPAEFRHGQATRADVDAWSGSLLGPNLVSRRIDIDGDGKGELFISQPAHAGTGGNSHLVLREERRGFCYLGRLSFGGLRPVGTDSDGRVRLMTSSRMGGGECMVTIHVLRPDGFHSLATRVLPCGDSATDGEGGRVFKLLFESDILDENTLRVVFGENF